MSEQSASVHQPVRWGFLGAGTIARTALAPAVHAADGAVLAAAAARDPARAASLGPERVHASYDALLGDPDVDAVYISLSNEAHVPWTVAALQAGKHVLCEKPLGLTAAEVDAVQAASTATGRTAVEASWYRWHPRVRLAQRHLPGRVAHVAAGFTFDGVVPGNYRLDPARGGGAMYDVGCYAVSACLWAVGQGLPVDVVARSTYDEGGVDLSTRAVLAWADGTEAEVHAAVSGDGERQWLVVTGDTGELELPGPSFTAWTGDATELWVSDGTGTELLAVPADDAYRLMVEEVSSVVSGGPGWVLPLAQSRQTASVLDAARASAAGGGVAVPVDPGS